MKHLKQTFLKRKDSETDGGPIPNEEATSTEQECWWMYVKPVFEALLAQTNEEFIAENVRIHEKKLNSSILEITMEELLNYWCICLSFGLNRQPSKTVYWANPDNSDGILGNDFVQSTMGRRKFGLINRFLSIDEATLKKETNESSKKHWNLGQWNSADDDLDKWKGMGQKIKIQKKEAKTGLLCWKIVDQNKYVWHIFYTQDFEWEAGDGEDKISMLYLKELEASLPPGYFIIVADAGTLSSLEAANFLFSKDRLFLLSCAGNRPSALWSYLQRNLDPFQ
eukprot:TRINITY_DN4854_c0_g1_i2.p1 TRINITY_DN4854_c0_g1~~TRINITY_DN4854_c0_g1_i2.p1  ORF type:complete len:281 (-),score=49.64 TRINITY_DN4854_c0_g1_i2:538-1380(-)